MSKFSCYVVNEKDELIIANGNLMEFLCKNPDGKVTHVLVSYTNDDNKIIKVFPIYRVYFGKSY